MSFLDCPIELIERQWDGIKSVKAGITYFQRFMSASVQSAPDYRSIEDECLETLMEYRDRDRKGLSHAGIISKTQQEKLLNKISKPCSAKESMMINTLVSRLNQETLCYTKHVAAHAAVFLGLSMGCYQMECFTPLGRHFKLKGPSLGVGMGIGASLSLPKGKLSKNKLAYRFKLYRQQEQSLWYFSNHSYTYALGAGIAVKAQPYASDKASMIHPEDYSLAVGISIYVEDLYNFMRHKPQSPFYMSLVMANLLDDMALAAPKANNYIFTNL